MTLLEDLVMDVMVDVRISPCSGVAADDSGGKEDAVPANQGLRKDVPWKTHTKSMITQQNSIN